MAKNNKNRQVLLDLLGARRLALQAQQYDKTAGKYVMPTKESLEQLMRGQQDVQLAELLAKSFTDVGLSHKGQVQYCFSESGIGGGLKAFFDPLRATTGVFTAQVAAGVSGTNSDKLLVMAQRGPSQLGQVVIPCPVVINSFQGVSWKGAASADVFVGVAIEMGVKVGGGAGAGESYTKLGSDVFKPESDDGNTEAETLALCFTASAGVKAGVKGSYENFFSQDVSPMYYVTDDVGKAQEQLKELFLRGTYKQVVKKESVDAVNGFLVRIGRMGDRISYESIWGGHAASSEIVDKFRGCLAFTKDKSGFDVENRRAIGYIEALSPWLDEKKKFRPVVPTTIRISGSEAAAGAGLVAYAKAEVGLFNVLGAAVGIEAEGLKLDGVYKTTTSRFQTAYPVGLDVKYAERNQMGYLVSTQDTEITYQQIEFTPVSLKSTASAKVKLGLLSSGKEAEIEREKELVSAETEKKLNRMSYISTTICWSYLPDSMEWSPLINRPAVKDLLVTTHEGTGVSYGGAFLLENLLRFYSPAPHANVGWWVNPEAKYIAPDVITDPLKWGVKDALKAYEDQTTGSYYFFTSSSSESKAAIDALNEIVSKPDNEGKLRPFVEYLLHKKGQPVPGFEHIQKLKLKSSIMGTPTRLYGLLDEAYKKSPAPEDIPNPVKPRESLHSDSVRLYIDAVAACLGVTYDELSQFLNSAPVFTLLYDLLEGEGLDSILLEAHFKIPGFGSCSVDINRDGEGLIQLVELSKDSTKSLIKKSAAASQRVLERISIRYRMQDTLGGTKELFSLGFQVAGSGFAIPIHSVEEAGRTGVVDLYTYWFNGKSNRPSDALSNWDDAVPPVVLFDR